MTFLKKKGFPMSRISTQRAAYTRMPQIHIGGNRPRKQELLSECDKLINKLLKLQSSPDLFREDGPCIQTALENLHKARRSIRIMLSK